MSLDMSPEEAVAPFVKRGAQCLLPAPELAARAGDIEALIFDWDGVFNDGKKGGDGVSGFSEADAMGTNMLRFGLWMRRRQMPVCALISGENNSAAAQFARREHYDAVYSAVRDKRLALDHLCSRHQLKTVQVACVFDDINDLAMARPCGLRFVVRRTASPLFTRYIADNGLCEYVTAATGGYHAVREIAEIILGLTNAYHAVVQSRSAFDTVYADYFAKRQAIPTQYYHQRDGKIRPVDNQSQ